MAKKVRYTVRYLVGGSDIVNMGCFRKLEALTVVMQDVLPAVTFLNKENLIWIYAVRPIEDRWLGILTRDSGIPLCHYPI